MEVHHHPDLHHNRKKWKEYFLEFMMIFLAVTLGFFAESYREHINDGERVKLLATQLVSDLKTDTARLQASKDFWENQMKIFDTLTSVLDKPMTQGNTRRIQQLMLLTLTGNRFTPTNNAIPAIQKESNLKQFIYSDLSAEINTYQQDLTSLEIQENVVSGRTSIIGQFITSHFMADDIQKGWDAMIIKLDKRYIPIDVLSGKMRNIRQGDLDEMNASYVVRLKFIKNLILMIEEAQKQAVELMQYTQNHFQVK